MKRGSKGDLRRCPSSSHSSTAITHTGSVKSSAVMARTTKKRLAGGRNTFSETQVGRFRGRAKISAAMVRVTSELLPGGRTTFGKRQLARASIQATEAAHWHRSE